MNLCSEVNTPKLADILKSFKLSRDTQSLNEMEQKELTALLENIIIDRLPDMFARHELGRSQIEELQAYLQSGKVEQPFPEKYQKWLKGKKFDAYQITLLVEKAFLAIEYSLVFPAFLQVAGALSFEITLQACKNAADDADGENSWFYRHLEVLEQLLPAKPDAFLRWYLDNHESEEIIRIAARQPNLVRKAADSHISVREYQFLLEQVKKGNIGLYQELAGGGSVLHQRRLAENLTAKLGSGRTEAKSYLLGEASLETLYPFVDTWQRNRYNFCESTQRLENLRVGNSRFFQRGVVLEALKMQGGFFRSCYLNALCGSKTSRKQLREDLEQMAQCFQSEGLPVRYQMAILEEICEFCYQKKEQDIFVEAVSQVIADLGGDQRAELREAAKKSAVIGRCISLRALDTFWQEEKETIFASALDKSSRVRKQFISICITHKEWEPDIRDMLSSQKAKEREAAMQILTFWGAENAQNAIAEASKRGKDKKQRDSRIHKLAWAYETPFPVVHKKDGREAEEEYLQTILTAYAEQPIPGVSREAEVLALELETEELNAYMAELFYKWLEAGAEVRNKWVLYAASVHGGASIVEAFRRQIQEWPQRARGAIAAEAVKALALNGSFEAMLYVDLLSRTCKYRQIKTAAGLALEDTADTLGITQAELEDRIVPSLGFDESFQRTFDYGTRVFHVYLTPNLELTVFNGANKKLKRLPPPGKRDHKEMANEAYTEYKQLKKQLKAIVFNQKIRLEQALILKRFWTAEAWKALFVKNPIMHSFAIGLIWGIYENSVLQDTFRYMEDGSFNAKDGEELILPKDAQIGLVHPIELKSNDLAVWKEQLLDYAIVQPIEQIERPVYRITEEEAEAKQLTWFKGKTLNSRILSERLLSMGWYRGTVLDAGIYRTFCRKEGPIGVEIAFSGCHIAEEGREITIQEVSFYHIGSMKQGSCDYAPMKKENRCRLNQISPRYLSEMIRQLTKAVVSGGTSHSNA